MTFLLLPPKMMFLLLLPKMKMVCFLPLAAAQDDPVPLPSATTIIKMALLLPPKKKMALLLPPKMKLVLLLVP